CARHSAGHPACGVIPAGADTAPAFYMAPTAAVTRPRPHLVYRLETTMSGPRRPSRPTPHDPRHTTADRSTADRSTTNYSTTNPAAGQLSGEEVLLYTPAEAAQRLRVRESWLRKKAAARQVPCTFLGKHLRFSPTDLAAIIVAAAQ